MALLFALLLPVSAATSLLGNGGFERGTADWQTAGEVIAVREFARNGAACLQVKSGFVRQDFTGLTPGATFTLSAHLRTRDLIPSTSDRPGYAFIAVYQLDDFDEVIAARDIIQVVGTQDWRSARATFTLAADCRTLSVRGGLFQATGTAWFDDFSLAPGEQALEFAAVAVREAALARQLGLTPDQTGHVAILSDDLPVSPGASSPERLAGVLQKAGFGVALLNSDQLADTAWLNRGVFDVLVLPSGPAFPVRAADNFRRFLKEGGKFLSTGGYAFDDLLERTPAGWRPPATPTIHESDGATWMWDIPAAELRGRGRLHFSGWLKAANVSGSGMAYFAVYQPAADGSLPEWRDVGLVRGSQDWQEIRYDFEVHPSAATVSLRAGLFRCRGVACFDDIRLVDDAGRVVLEDSFEADFDPDQRAEKRWFRTDPRLCEVQSRTQRSGHRALKVKLRYEPPREERLNTRQGVPADGLEVAPTQLGVFQADYPIERAAAAAAAPDQSVLDRNVRVEGPLAGWAACGLVGWNHARWQPLLNTQDRYGRPRGAAGALLRHYAGPWAGSTWAFFGVTNRDLFAEAAMGPTLAALVRALVRDVGLVSLVPDRACYHPGETVKLQARVFNGGRVERRVRVGVELFEGEPDQGRSQKSEVRRGTFTAPSQVVVIAPGDSAGLTFEWAPGRFGSDFYHVLAQLWDEAEEVDRIESGFVVWDERVVARGPKLALRGNYLRTDGRPTFLFGTDDWSYVLSTDRETPLQWLRDMRQRRDLGVQIYENLLSGLPAPTGRDRLFRQVDGLVQLAQKHGQVFFPGLLVGENVAANDTELARQAAWCGDFAARYARVPGLIYYLNGDLRCELGDDVTPQWNEFLRQRYGGTNSPTAALRAAWEMQALGKLKAQSSKLKTEWVAVEDFQDSTQSWDSVKASDYSRFRAALIRRWHAALVGAIRAHDAVHPTTSEFYQLPHAGVDLPAGIGAVDLANFGYFDRPGADLARFPAISVYNDQRARGKSSGPGEYGVKTHPAWGDGRDHDYHTARTRDQAVELFLGIAHYAFGLGASRIHNWCWKDDAHRVFPWGMVWPCDGVPKDIAWVHRNQSLLFRQFAPVYQEPEVYVLTADRNRLGGGKFEIIEGILTAIDLALSIHVGNLGTLNEVNLAPEPELELPVQRPLGSSKLKVQSSNRRPRPSSSNPGSWSQSTLGRPTSKLPMNPPHPGIPASARVIFYPLPFCPPDEVCQKLLAWVKTGGVLYLSGDVSYDDLRQRTRTARLEELCGVRFIAENYPALAVPGTPLARNRGERAHDDDLPCIQVEPMTTATVLKRARDGSPLAFENRLGRGRVIFNTDPIEMHSTPARRPADRELFRRVLMTAGIMPLGLAPDDALVHTFRVPLQNGGSVWVLFNTDTNSPTRTVTLTDLAPPVTLTIPRQRPALVWLDAKGNLRAIEAEQARAEGRGQSAEGRMDRKLSSAVRGFAPILDDETGGIVLSLDGWDVRRSGAVLFMPLRAGRIRLAREDDGSGFVVETGEIRNTRWHPFESVPLRREGREWVVAVDADQALSLLLVAPQRNIQTARRAVEESFVKPRF